MGALLKKFGYILRRSAVLGGMTLGACSGDVPTSSLQAGPEVRRLILPTTYAQISAGGAHTCVLSSMGSVMCIGSNYAGETDAPAGQFTAVSAGYRHTCALDAGSMAVCWGFLETAPAGSFAAISSGYMHTCALRGDGSASCWGSNEYGQSTPPPGAFASVSAGRYHTCGVRPDGTASCWGDNSQGQSSPPSETFAAVTAGFYHACGLRSDLTVVCWGSNADGQSSAPGGQFKAVSAGAENTCGLRSDDTATCWGKNDLGQSSPPTGTFAAISAGSWHACGHKFDGSATCWGDNLDDRASPVFRVLPTATFTAPGSVIVGQPIPLALTNAQVPGFPGATSFTYAFDCGTGFASASSANTTSCATTTSGTRTVQGKVIDQDGDAALYSASVSVLSVPAATTQLRAEVSASTLSPDIRKAFFAKLDAALKALEKGQTAAACQSLQDFINQLKAQRGKAVPEATADAWLVTAQALRTGLGC